jgi:hypothetical protein
MRQGYYGDFGSLSFPKKGAQIVGRAQTMLDEVTAKIVEREGRIRAAANESGMKSAGDVLVGLQSIAEGSSGAGDFNMNVGLAAKVKGEIAALNADRAEREKLTLIVNNLPHEREFDLTFAELRYFGF